MSLDHADAARRLARRSPVFRRLHREVGPPRLGARASSAYVSLARAIVFQQLAGAAARTIWGRFEARVGRPVRPERVAAIADAELAACGLSRAKLAAIRDLTARALDGRLRLRGLSRLEDEAVIEQLVAVRGVGRWTAEMFLIFHLRRLDVWPVGDLGVQEGYRRAFALDARPGPRELDPLGEPFRPYRSVAAWYLWRATEIILPG